jgi:hypothetical protein
LADFEKLGVFYLGKKYDLSARRRQEDLVLYQSSDLTTHAVCIGMTGSGKTGLCLGLIEEAAIDGIPVIAIDPKGDLSNLLLTFPELAASDFAPWVDAGEARRQGVSPEVFAAAEADKWKRGLAEWGEDGERIARVRAAADFDIYTPGSSAGIAVSILHSLSLPEQAIREDADLMREKVSGAAACILALLGLSFDPLKSRDYILLTSIIGSAWAAGQGLALTDLIALIQKPPVARIGAIDLESFYPAKERLELSLAINNLLASPGFDAWMTGVPLDVDKFLYNDGGKPRVSIFSISHLTEQERMFFVTILLNEITSWMRSQTGTPSLRAILYMDEIFGYFPPVANPPAKQPLLTLLKQARAYGLGILLATQNPVDIDYKGLSNAGTWFIGRLQTDRDKQRVLDGLESAAGEAASSHGHGGFDRERISATLSSLGQRVFLLNNVHEDEPTIFETRWTMSYLRGPLARPEIKRLMEPVKAKLSQVTDFDSSLDKTLSRPAAAAAFAPTPEKKTQSTTIIDPNIIQLFVPPAVAAFSSSDKNNYEATLLASASVHFVDTKLGVDVIQERNYLVPVAAKGALAIDLNSAKAIKIALADIPLTAPPITAPSLAGSSPLNLLEPHPDLLRADKYKDYGRDFLAYLTANCKLKLMSSPASKMVSRPGESERDFRIRAGQSVGEKRDAMITALREKYNPKINALMEKVRQAESHIAQEEAQARQADVDSAIAIGATVFGAMMSRRPLGSTSVGRASSAARGVNRAAKQRQDVEQARQTRDEMQAKLSALEAEFKSEVASLSSRIDSQNEVLQEIVILPKKTNIKVNLVGLGWVKG